MKSNCNGKIETKYIVIKWNNKIWSDELKTIKYEVMNWNNKIGSDKMKWLWHLAQLNQSGLV